MRIKTDIPLSISFIKNALGILSSCDDESTFINAICTDTRIIENHDLFIPLKGEVFNGEAFIKDAVCKGAYALSIDYKHPNVFNTDSTQSALFKIANAYKRLLNLKATVAITGSVGKTTTKELALSILSEKFICHGTYKNLNNEIGVPITLLSAPKNTEILVIEAGMNHSGELSRISRCIEPDISVITKIGSAHIGNLGSRDAIAKAKLEILDGMKKQLVIVPYEEPLLKSTENKLTFSKSTTLADYSLIKSQNSSSNSGYLFSHSGNPIMNVNIPISFEHIPECLGYALSIASVAGMDKDTLYSAMQNLKYPSNVKCFSINGITLIDDSYNASLESVEYAFKNLKNTPAKRHCALLGDMLELGGATEELHKKVGKLAVSYGIDFLYLFGNYSNYVADGAIESGFEKNKILIFESPLSHLEASEILSLRTKREDAILFKASRKLNVGKISDLLYKKLSFEKGEKNERL